MKLVKGVVFSTILATATLMSGEVLATVNGNNITKSTVNSMLKAQHMSFDQLTKGQQKQLVSKLIERELLIDVANKAGVENDPAYKETLENYKKDLAIKVWMDQIFKKTLISDSEAKNYYNAHKDKFKVPAKVHARHILVKTEDEAKKLIAQLSKLKGEELKKKFIELAKSKSTGPSGKNGGDLGYFAKGQMVKPFNDAAFSMKKGELSKAPIKTQFGYHIIYVEDTKPVSVADFKDVKESIVAQMKQEQFAKTIKNTIDKQKKSAKITSTIKLDDNNSK